MEYERVARSSRLTYFSTSNSIEEVSEAISGEDKDVSAQDFTMVFTVTVGNFLRAAEHNPKSTMALIALILASVGQIFEIHSVLLELELL